MKKVLIVVLCLGFVLLLSLGLFAACVVSGTRHFGFTIGPDEKANRVESHDLDLSAGRLLEVDLGAGTIRVTATSAGAPSLSATITAFGRTQEKANEALELARLDVRSTAEGCSIRLVDGVEGSSILKGLSLGNRAEADIEVRVPAGVRLDLRSGSGSLEADGPFAGSKLHSSYGSVRIHDVEGDLEATSSSGDVSVSGAKGKRLTAKSSYGNVVVRDCESGEVDARSSSGDVKLEGVRGENLRVGSSYGEVRLVDVAGDVEAKLASGDVHLEGWKGAQASLATSYGEVSVERAAGSISAKSASGSVNVRGLEGALSAHSSYGSVEAEGVFSSLVASSSSGDVSARARTGSRVEGDWQLASSYGNVKLRVPHGFGCRLDARTAYGEVDVGPQLEAQPGTQKKGHVEGKLNGGGGLVELKCKSGSVSVEADGG